MGNCSVFNSPTAVDSSNRPSSSSSAMGLDEQTIAILKATAPVVQEHGTAITTTMYRILFSEYPEVKNVFNMSHQRKVKDDKDGSEGPSTQVNLLTWTYRTISDMTSPILILAI